MSRKKLPTRPTTSPGDAATSFCAKCAASEIPRRCIEGFASENVCTVNCQRPNETIRFLSHLSTRRRNFNVNVQTQPQCSIGSVGELGDAVRRVAGIRG